MIRVALFLSAVSSNAPCGAAAGLDQGWLGGAAVSRGAWFVPNQLAANAWYRPMGTVINGHVAGSFTNLSLWPALRTGLAAQSGGLGVYAAELAFLSAAQLAAFAAAGLPIQAEDPTWTQCQSVGVISELALYGRSPPGQDLFCSIFRLCNSSRPSPLGLGWYLSAGGASYAPTSIVFDERMPNLLAKPSSDPAVMAQLWNASLPWPARKAAAFVDPCPAMNAFRPGVDRVRGITADYVDFVRAAAARFGPSPPPAFGLHWNVIAWWEWLDTACLDALNAAHANDTAAFRAALLGLAAPCHRDTDHLLGLAAALCGNGSCPEAVYMDVDYTYNTAYALDVLARNKAGLAALYPPVPFGLNIVDECGTAAGCVVVDTGDALETRTRAEPYDSNMLHEESLVAVYGFFVRKGIIDAETRVRVASWSVRPQEQGAQVDERIAGSMAHAANRVFDLHSRLIK